MRESDLRQNLAETAHRLHARGLVVALEGNLSARLTSGSGRRVGSRSGMSSPGEAFSWLLSPSGVCKGDLHPRDFLLLDRNATATDAARTRGRRASTELDLHLGIYRHLPEAAAVIHAHSPYCSAFACTAQGMTPLLQPELVQLLGGPVPLAPYARPGTAELFASIRPYLETSPVILLANHGVVAVSRRSPQEALMFLEQVEQVARIMHLARQLGDVRPLPPAEIQALRRQS